MHTIAQTDTVGTSTAQRSTPLSTPSTPRYVLIDLAEAWPGALQAYPKTLLDYSSTGSQVLGLYAMREEGERALADAHDHSGRQQLRLVRLEQEG